MNLNAAFVDEFGVAPSLNRLPSEILLQIFLLFDDPTSFSQTSRAFLKLSRDVYFRARWFRNRFPPYLILFEAIARPKILDVDLVKRLLKTAPLSRHLVQLLHLLHNPAEVARHPHCRNTDWASNLSFGVYLAILEAAYARWGDGLSFQPNDFDDWRMVSSFEEAWEGHPYPLLGMEEMMVDGCYMPLPIGFVGITLQPGDALLVYTSPANEYAVEHALAWHPELAPFMLHAGYEPTFERSIIISRLIVDSECPNTCDQRMAKLVELQGYGILRISRTIICNIFLNMIHHTAPDDAPQDAPSYLDTWYDACIKLDTHQQLKFKMDVFVQSFVTQLAIRGAVDVPILHLIERLDRYYPSVDTSSLFVPAQFLKAEINGIHELDIVKGMMGRHAVTRAHVMKACLRNGCKTTVPIKFAARYVEGFDAESFLAEFIEALLHQPYRGIMLRELNRLASDSDASTLAKCDFRRMLAAAVERKAFTLDQLPDLQYTQDSAQDNYFRRMWSHRVISLLTYDWRRSEISDQEDGRDRGSWVIRNLNKNSPSIDPRPTGALGFTQFISQEELSQENESSASSEVAESSAYSPDPGPDGLGVVEVDRLWNVARRPDAGCPRDMQTGEAASLKRRCQNILGPIDEDEDEKDVEAIATAIADIIGHTSKAANVVLSHAFLNDNDRVIHDLLAPQRSVPLTLEHLKIALKSHGMQSDPFCRSIRSRYNPPYSSVSKCIEEGAPFLVSHGAKENEADHDLLELSADLSASETERYRELATSSVWPRALRVHDEAGIPQLQQVQDPETHQIARIITRSVRTALADLTDRCTDDTSDETATNQQLQRANTVEDAPAPGRIPIQERFLLRKRAQKGSFILGRRCFYAAFERSTLAARLNNAKVWLQHLQGLANADVRLLRGLKLAFADTREFSDRDCNEVSDVCRAVKLLLEELPVATPCVFVPRDHLQMLVKTVNAGTHPRHQELEDMLVHGKIPPDFLNPASAPNDALPSDSNELESGANNVSESAPASQGDAVAQEASSSEAHDVASGSNTGLDPNSGTVVDNAEAP